MGSLHQDFLAKPYAPEKEMVVKCGILDTSRRAHILLCVHHIVTDGYSNRIIKDLC